MKRVFLFLFLIAFFACIVVGWILLGSGTAFSKPKATLYISSRAITKQAVLDSLTKNKIISNPSAFVWLANRLNYFDRIKPGKYEISKGASLLSIIRKLRNGAQTPVKLTITHIRLKEDIARMTGNKFEFDSIAMMNFLNSDDSLRPFNVTADQAMTLVLPDTYTFYWNTTPKKVFKKLADVGMGFWTKERMNKADALNLKREEVYTIASIVEEETNAQQEKGNIASVYMNRLQKGMALQADPTIKFALKDFTLKRIYEKHLSVESPYNTYRNKGLPPGPICTPSRKTIDAVLNAPKTSYMFFVASPEFNGTHEFSTTYEEHLLKAKAYQQALDRLDFSKSASR